jgi:hypothetical protein
MSKRLPLCFALVLGLLVAGAAGAALAAPASAAGPQADLAALHQAIFTPDLDAAGLPPGAQPMALLCSPPTIYFCVNEQCYCRQRCATKGIKSFTCNESAQTFKCVCNS